MVEQVIASAGMKLVTAQKFRQGLSELHGAAKAPQARGLQGRARLGSCE